MKYIVLIVKVVVRRSVMNRLRNNTRRKADGHKIMKRHGIISATRALFIIKKSKE